MLSVALKCEELITRGIIVEVDAPVRAQYINVITVGRTDGRTDGRLSFRAVHRVAEQRR